MRFTCLKCVLKHLGQAMILVEECRMGYPFHRYFAMAHMAEASSESYVKYPLLAQQIRDERKKFEELDEDPNILSLMAFADELLTEEHGLTPTPFETESGEKPSEMTNQLAKAQATLKIEPAEGTISFNKAVPGAQVIDKALQEVEEGQQYESLVGHHRMEAMAAAGIPIPVRPISKPLHPCGDIVCGHSMWDHELQTGKCKLTSCTCQTFVPVSAEQQSEPSLSRGRDTASLPTPAGGEAGDVGAGQGPAPNELPF